MFDKIIEQNRIKKILEGAILQDKVGHAYLFCGSRGTGKATLARSFAAALLCTAEMSERPCGQCAHCLAIEHGTMPDYLHVGLQPEERTIKIKQVRELKSLVAEKTYDGNRRICLITDADKMTVEAQNALLKTLEEPYPGNVFLLTAENKESILPTIRSRCQVLQTEPVSDDGLREALDRRDIRISDTEAALFPACGGSIGAMLEKISDEARGKIKNEALSLIYDIINGKPEGIFAFAEKMGKLKQESAALVSELILLWENLLKAFNLGETPADAFGARIASVTDGVQTAEILESLFGFSDRLRANINLRLAWESLLLNIYTITEKKA